jgi:hypothetical protein
MQYHVPKYVSPKESAERKARLIRRLLLTAIALPPIFFFFLYGYSDQAPAALRSAIIAFDRAMGFPIAWLISTIMG